MKVDARRCDGSDCGKLLLAEDIVTLRKTFRSEDMNGFLVLDLCYDCADTEVPEGVTLSVPRGAKDDPEEPSTT